MFKTTLLALDPRMKSVSVLSLSGSHLGPSLRTGLPALLTRIKSVLGRPKPEKKTFIILFFTLFGFLKFIILGKNKPDLITILFLVTGELLVPENDLLRTWFGHFPLRCLLGSFLGR